jgi:hypothetical protein
MQLITFRDIYKLCTAIPTPFPERLYVELRRYLEAHVKTVRQVINSDRQKIEDHYGNQVLEYRRHWRAYSVGSEALHRIFNYLNNNWIKMRLAEARNKLGNLYHGGALNSDHSLRCFRCL